MNPVVPTSASPNEGVSATRSVLLRTAERLYARRGLDGVSLREINRQSDQKNSSAIHYHFGSREAVIEGIFQMRGEYINRRRHELLTALRGQLPALALRSVIAGILQPHVELLRAERGSYHYNRFLAQAALSGDESIRALWRQYFGQALEKFAQLSASCLPQLPAALLRQRLAINGDFIISGMASLERLTESHQAAGSAFRLEPAVDNLIDMLTGALSAPVSLVHPSAGRRADSEKTDRQR